MQDVGVYVADAPYQSLQLIGGTHDWWYLLSHFEKIAWANEISRGVWLIGLAVGVIGLGLIVTPPALSVWSRPGDGTDIRVPEAGPNRVRERRQPQ